MNPNPWTSTPPQEPGTYEWSDGNGGETQVRIVYRAAFNGDVVYATFAHHGVYHTRVDHGGYWRKYVGEKYEAPKPPKVELFTARTRSGEWRLLVRVGCVRGGFIDVRDAHNTIDNIQPYKPE